MQATRTHTQFGLVQIGIVVLALVTALIHFSLSMRMGFDLMFTLNGLGYIGLLAALFLPIPILVRYRPVIRILMILYTLVTIVAWVFLGERNTIGYVDKLIEAALVVLLWFDRGRDH